MADENIQTGESTQVADLARGAIMVLSPGTDPAESGTKTDVSGNEESHLLRKVTEHHHDGADSDRISFRDIKDFIEVVSAAPTHKPRLLSDSIKLFGSSLYIYNYKTNLWKIIGSSNSYGGSSNGPVLPTGWTITNPSVGNYQVTHNLGTANYGLVLTVQSMAIPLISSKGTTTFNVNTKTLAGADSNTSFDFVLVLTT